MVAVSHDYHLARIRMLARRDGPAVRTVPAHESQPLVLKPYFVVREVVAWLIWYWVPRG